MATELKQVTLKRISFRPDGTFGVLLIGDLPICVTVERPWRNNEKGISCIPSGSYIARRVASPKFGDTFEVTQVPNRTAILFHSGNLADDSHGCIILGESYNIWTDGRGSVASSKIAVAEFLKLLKDSKEFQLTVNNIKE